MDWATLIVGSKITVFALFLLRIWGTFSKYKPPGGLYLEERFNGGFFALPIWRGLYKCTWICLFSEFHDINVKNCVHELKFFASELRTCLAMTPSIPLKAVTREIVDAIHTRTTVLTSVVDTVINICKVENRAKFYFLSKLGNKIYNSDNGSSLNRSK